MPRSLRVSPQYIEAVRSALTGNEFARQQDLAEDLGISRDTVSKFFNGKPVGYLNFYEICQKLGLDLQTIAADFVRKDGEIIKSASASLCNLPHRNHSLIGREKELQKLISYISPEYRQHMTIVQGIGGMGKTSLVVEAAHLCWEAARKSTNSDSSIPIFDAIIFTSAKDTDLLPFGVIQRPIKEVTLQDIFKTIARVLNNKEIAKASNDEQIELVYESLARQRTLLIVDNMETVKGKDREDILAFLNNLPSTVQTVITTRERVWFFSPISLLSLSEEHSILLIQQQAQAKKIQLTTNDCQKLYGRFGGVPLALIYLVGRLAGRYSLQRLLEPSVLLPEDMASFCFEESVQPLRTQPAHHLLMSLAIFRTKSEWKALAKVSDLQTEPLRMEQGLDKLKQLSLIHEESDKYKILPITREYALVELSKFPIFEEQARQRWIEYYLEFTKKYGGEDWRNWRVKYDVLEEDWSNILQVLDWCAVNGPYEEVIVIWKNIDNYIDLKGDWDNRLKWWSWLEIQSSRLQDCSTQVNALSAQAWILILKGRSQFTDATQKIEQAWEVSEESPEVFEAKANLATIHSVLLKIIGQYQKSLEKLEEGLSLIRRANIEEKHRRRYCIRVDYCRAEVHNCSEYQNHNLETAKTLFHQVCVQGSEIEWSRIVNYAQNELANIAISEQDYSCAEEIINKGLLEAEVYRESTRIGHWLFSSWRLALAQGNLEQAKQHAKKALYHFNAVEGASVNDAKKIKTWLGEINLLD